MSEQVPERFEGQIRAVVRARCIGYQRGDDGLVSVIEMLADVVDGPFTLVYQLVPRTTPPSPLLRARPRVDIPAPPAYMGE